MQNTSIGRTGNETVSDGKNWKALESCHTLYKGKLYFVFMSWILAFSARPGVLPASQTTSSVRLFRVLSGANIHTSLSPSLAADEASQLLGWALQAHRILYPIQAHGCLRVHRLQCFRGRTALRVLRALQQAWGLSHHHVQQRSSPVGQVLFPPFVAVTLSLQVGDLCWLCIGGTWGRAYMEGFLPGNLCEMMGPTGDWFGCEFTFLKQERPREMN